jgi:hypothetical protein
VAHRPTGSRSCSVGGRETNNSLLFMFWLHKLNLKGSPCCLQRLATAVPRIEGLILSVLWESSRTGLAQGSSEPPKMRTVNRRPLGLAPAYVLTPPFLSELASATGTSETLPPQVPAEKNAVLPVPRSSPAVLKKNEKGHALQSCIVVLAFSYDSVGWQNSVATSSLVGQASGRDCIA